MSAALKGKNLRNKVLRVLNIFQERTPEPRCELIYKTPFQLLVSVVLSAQTTDKAVNRAVMSYYEKGLFTPAWVRQIAEKDLLEILKTLGLAPTKTRHIKKIADLLGEHFRDQVPSTLAELESLPGVGCKTANVVLAELFNEPTLAVDTHVLRVSRRLGWHRETDPQACEKVLLKLIPKKYLPAAHHWLILHGRYVCQARKPKCHECPVYDLCQRVFD